jgi:RNA polymerase sigma-70 factor (ECF subfamily)
VQGGRITGVITLTVRDGVVTGIRAVRNPEKLTLWGDAYA